MGAERAFADARRSLSQATIRYCVAGRDLQSAGRPAVFETPEVRVLVYSWAVGDSGVPLSWAANESQPGVNYLPDTSNRSFRIIARRIQRRPGDLVVASLNWGDNWGYELPKGHRELARDLIDQAGVPSYCNSRPFQSAGAETGAPYDVCQCGLPGTGLSSQVYQE